MEKRRLGKTDIYVSPLALGTLTIGHHQLNLPVADGGEIIKYALKNGVNFIDTAQSYKTYPYLKEGIDSAFKDGSIKEYPVISTKSRATSHEQMKDAVNEALSELGITTIDIFLLHEVREDPDWQNRSGAWECLQEYKARGIIRAIGVSTHHIDVVERMAETPACDVVFPLINYAGLGIRKGPEIGSAEEMAMMIARCADAGKGVYAMKAFGGGNLTKHYIRALDYVDTLKGIDSVMIGMGTVKEVDTAVAYFEGRLSKEFQADVSKKRIRIVGCEGCGTCINVCPNKVIYQKENGEAEIDHDRCLTCGYCAPACPVRAIVMW
ncbi:MAG: aldo/keto reductase [Bacillota bacterium]|nr:aldo/keto reductase [Bacillota bacterium]